MLRVILERMRKKTDVEISEEQAGFRKGKGTRSYHKSSSIDRESTGAPTAIIHVFRLFQKSF